MTQQAIFGLLLENSPFNIENQCHIYPSLFPEGADFVTEKFANILYNSLKTTSSDHRRINILKFLQSIVSVERRHYSLNDKNIECVLKHLANNSNKKSEFEIILEECELDVKKHKSELHEKIIRLQKNRFQRQTERNMLIEFRRNRQKEVLNKRGIIANISQSRSVYEPNEKNIEQIFKICEETEAEKAIHFKNDRKTREFRFKQIKFGYAINNVGKQFEVEKHLETILDNLKKYDQLYDFERLFLQHIFKNIDKFVHLDEDLIANFCQIMEMSAIRLCDQIIRLDVQAVNHFFQNINNDNDFVTLKKLTQENKKPINVAEIKKIITRENAFIKDLFSKMWMPPRYEEENEETDPKGKKQFPAIDNNKSRAQSLTELQQRLEALKSKRNLSYKDKILKKGIKNKLKKKDRQEQRKTQKVLVNVGKIGAGKIKQETFERPAKPVFNSEGKMVFSKFDFSNIGNNTQKKNISDPKKILQNLEKRNQKINDLKDSGEIEKAIEITERTAWKNALAKAGGEKVKDDPKLLKKSIKKREQKHKSSKKKWEAREDSVTKKKEERQQKRQENIDKRKKTKKLTKLKKASKKGKIIPGF